MKTWMQAGCVALSLTTGLQAATVTVSVPNWNSYAPHLPFRVGTFYRSPYTEVIYVRDAVYHLDGSVGLLIENVQGRWCKYAKACVIPAETPRGTFFEVQVTITP
jgi:hypothetical protein